MKLPFLTQFLFLPFMHVLGQDVLLPGYGNSPYYPICARACFQAFRPYILNCTDLKLAALPFDPVNPPTPPSCYAKDPAFLASAAWCLSSRCPDVTVAALEAIWQITASNLRTLAPSWSYTVALEKVDPKPPKMQLTTTDISLNQTSLIPEAAFVAASNGMVGLVNELVSESKYSITLIVFALGVPIVLTWALWLPFVEILADKIKPYIIYPSIIGTYHIRPLPYQLGNIPTVGQALYVAVFVVLNVILSAVEYQTHFPNAFYGTRYKELLTFITLRTGAFAFVLLPVLFLFSSRNNILLYITNWSHSTFLLLHRWIARLFMVHVVVHSIAAFQVYRFYETAPWWYWGIVGTVLTVALTIGSGLFFRAAQYELFLISHVVLSVLMLVGSWYHLTGWYELLLMTVAKRNTYGYEVWFYFGIAVWFVDRLVRVLRVVRWGPLRAKVTEIGEHHLRVDIPGVRWGMDPARHVYAYFPTLRPWTPWENHPFSVVPTYLLQRPRASGSDVGDKLADEEKQLVTTRTSTRPDPMSTAGITLFVGKSMGMTRYLKSNSSLLTFLDGPYQSTSKANVLQCDRLLIIAGGIGITGALPWAYSHPNAKLVWSVKEVHRELADAVDLAGVATNMKEIKIGSRFNVEELIAEEENTGWARVGVVVCGPGSLCDDVRATVVAAGRRAKTVFELEIDSFTW